MRPEKNREVRVGDLVFGNGSFQVIAGPCSIESEEQYRTTSEFVRSCGAQALRGGIYKMRTDPKAFQGLGPKAYPTAHKIKSEVQMPLFSEVTDPRQIPALGEIVDCFQVGARNMHNYELLKELGRQPRPVLLKRNFSATLLEWVKAAEYIELAGNDQIILCERGIRTFESATRNTLDLGAVAYVKTRFGYPVIVDPSHGIGIADLVPRMALAGMAAGADGLIIEVHSSPEEALSDRDQALSFGVFQRLMKQIHELSPHFALERSLRP